MILKENSKKLIFLLRIKKFISKLIYFIGTIVFFLIILIIGYYYTSGMYERFKPVPLIKKIDKVILDKYLGFSIFEIDEYIKIKFISLKYIFIDNEFENVVIKIDQKNIYNLELQRKNKIKNITTDLENFSKAQLETKKKITILKLE